MAESEVAAARAQTQSARHRPMPLWQSAWVVDLGIFVTLSVVAWAIAHNYLGSSLFAWGDHPGQFMRFWYPLRHAMPDSGLWLWGVTGWNPTWYAGYPELQFYPPGTSLLGIALYTLTLGLPSPERIYNCIPAIAFVLPLFTCYSFLRYALAPLGRLPSMLAGVSAGLLAVSLKPMWGGIDGVVIGLMGERLAFGFAPLLLLAGWRMVERPSVGRLCLAAAALAWLLLLHPFHAPAIVLAVALYSCARITWRPGPDAPSPWRQFFMQARWLASWLLLAVALIAWWLLPLLVHYSPYAAALVRATTDQVITWFDAGRIEWLWLAALMALMLLAQDNPRVTGTVGVLALLAPLLVGGILFNDQILLARFHITLFDPIRFIAEYYLALILLVGCAVAAVTSRFLWRNWWLALICTTVVLVTMQPYVTLAAQDLADHVTVNPGARLDTMRRNPAFDGYWDALQSDPAQGRIFFVSNYLQLTGEDGVVTPTTVNSLIPYLIGREIVGGTFSHWSPIARWLWVGDARATLLPAQVESGDNRQIFGKPWSEISGDQLAANFAKLNVTTVVAGANDQQAIHLMEASPQFAPYWKNDAFTIFHVTSHPGAWIDASGADATLIERTPRHWRIHVQHSDADATLLLKMSDYPLWQASVAGARLTSTATAEGLQQITLPAGGPYTVDVVYRNGWAEWSGLVISMLALLLILAILLLRHRQPAILE